MKEDHSLVLNLSFPISLGLLPVTLHLETTGCGIKNSELPDDEAGDVDNSSELNTLLDVFCNIFHVSLKCNLYSVIFWILTIPYVLIVYEKYYRIQFFLVIISACHFAF